MALRLAIALLQFSIILALGLGAAAEEETALQQLGQLLGLTSQPQVQPQETPDFVKDLYHCLNLNGADSTNCVPGYHGSDANKVRTSLGIGKSLPGT